MCGGDIKWFLDVIFSININEFDIYNELIKYKIFITLIKIVNLSTLILKNVFMI
jgi:hypothetical protein